MQKLLGLIMYHLLIFVFILIKLGHRSPKILLWFMSKRVFCMFSSYSVQPYIRSLIHFELIFLYSVTGCSNFILLHVAVQFSRHHYGLSFLHCISSPSLL